MTVVPPPDASTLPQLLRNCAQRWPNREALVVGSCRLSYAKLSAQADVAASALADLGVSARDTVALLAPNRSEWVEAAFGALALGARVDAFNTWVKAYELEHLLESSTASVLLLVDRVRGSDLIGELKAVVPQLVDTVPGQWRSARFPELREVVVIGSDVPTGARDWSDLMRSRSGWPATPRTAARAEDAAFVVYTSGSTEHPKAVPLCHRDLIVNGFYIGERMGLTERDRVWFGSPLFWSYGCANGMMATFTHGACFVLDEQFEPESSVELMARERVTAAYLLPTMVSALAEQVADRMRAVSTLRTGLTIGRPDEIELAATGLDIPELCNVYGSTETYGNCCVTDHAMPLTTRLTTQGEPLPGVEIRTVEQQTGEVLPPGTAGEIQVRGRVTPGYLNDDEANRAAFAPDGWFRTGDRAVQNQDGTVSFVGRISDMIKTSGINVSPAEVETFLRTHPDVTDVVVVGAPHPSKGEVVVAFVVARTEDLSAEDVITYCRARIAGYKVPSFVSIVNRLPRTGTGKIERRTLLAAAESLAADRGNSGEGRSA